MGGQSLILLDTQALIWLDRNDATLGREARELSDHALGEGELAVSAIAFWEVAMLVSKRRVELSDPIAIWRQDLLRSGLRELPLDGGIGIAATELEDLPLDPADRMIVATAIKNGATLITSDRRILAWSGALRRHDARK